MPEKRSQRVHTEQVVLDIGGEIGALIISTRPQWRGREIEVSLKEQGARKIHTEVQERRFNGRTVFAAVFQELAAGNYIIWRKIPYPTPGGEVTIVGGEIAEVDWRDLDESAELAIPPNAYPRAGEQRPSGPPPISTLASLLPPRYRTGRAVSAAPMGAASLRYDDDGRVAWNEIWTDFCDLALAGGPPHRGTLLEPVAPDEVRAAQEAYERVVAEIERGLRQVTGLPTVRSERLGWIGLRCENEEMALWLLQAIIVENVCVRREGTVLFLPAGPDFQLEKEIKNVITVVAKTYHYWTEHCSC